MKVLTLLAAVVTLSLLSGCAKDSQQSTLVGSWTKASVTGPDCDGADTAFAETRSFTKEGITSDGVTTVPFKQGTGKTAELNGRVYYQNTLNFNNQERLVSYNGDTGMTLQSNPAKECFYNYTKN